jgi:glycosyltransferase involved in cell wall biosynthesis
VTYPARLDAPDARQPAAGRVLIVSTDYGPPWNEGEKNIAHALDRRLGDHGWSSVVCSNPSSDVTASSRHRPTPAKLAGALRFWLLIARRARQERATVIHLLSSVSSALGLKCRVVRRASGVPLLLHVTGLAQPIRGFRRFLEADRVVVGGSYLAPLFPGADDVPPVSPHQNPRLEVDARRGAHVENRGRLLYLGHMEQERGVHTLIEALSLLARRPGGPDAVLTLAWNGQGNPAYAEAIRARIDALGLSRRIRWEGVVEDMGALYRAHDVVVVPQTASERMGFPLRVVEALSYGKPVVASDVGEMPRVVDGCGVVVPRGEAAALAGALERLAADERLYHDCVRKAFEQAAVYDPARTVARLVDLYRSIGTV